MIPAVTDFDAEAGTWDAQPGRLDRARTVAQEIRRTVPLTREMAALEYGAGTGLLGRQLAGDLASITFADASAGMTEVATATIAGLGAADTMRAVRLDLMTDPVPEERYDLVLSMMALHHVDDIPALLAAFHTLLREGGRLALVDLDAEDGSFHEGDFAGHHGFARDALAAQLEEAGFAEVGFRTAYTVSKEVDGQARDFPLFLATARRD